MPHRHAVSSLVRPLPRSHREHVEGTMRKQTGIIALVAVILTMSGSAPHLARSLILAIDPTLPTVQTWKREDGRRIDVVPACSYAPATISSSITATGEGGGRVALDMAGTLWSAAGNVNTSAPVVRLLGVAGRPLNWNRVPIKIDRAVIRRKRSAA